MTPWRRAPVLRVIAASLTARSGAAYDVADVTAKLEALATTKLFPKLPNDTPFEARDHVTTQGKRYARTTQRWHGRKTTGESGELRTLWAD